MQTLTDFLNIKKWQEAHVWKFQSTYQVSWFQFVPKMTQRFPLNFDLCLLALNVASLLFVTFFLEGNWLFREWSGNCKLSLSWELVHYKFTPTPRLRTYQRTFKECLEFQVGKKSFNRNCHIIGFRSSRGTDHNIADPALWGIFLFYRFSSTTLKCLQQFSLNFLFKSLNNIQGLRPEIEPNTAIHLSIAGHTSNRSAIVVAPSYSFLNIRRQGRNTSW